MRVTEVIPRRDWWGGKQIEVFYLPPYTPNANPDEMLNRVLKTELRLQPSALDVDALNNIARNFMNLLAGILGSAVKYFSSRQASYAVST